MGRGPIPSTRLPASTGQAAEPGHVVRTAAPPKGGAGGVKVKNSLDLLVSPGDRES